MAHRPEVLKTFVPFYGAVTGPGSVERRVKELVYLTCSYANECAFCTAPTPPAARKPASPTTKLRALQTEQDHVFSEPERAAIAYARELTQNAAADDSREALMRISTTSRSRKSPSSPPSRISRTASITA